MTDSTNLSAEAAVDAAPTDDLNSAADMPASQGASGAERLQLAQAVVDVPMPNPGETVTITAAAGQTLRLAFDYAAAGNGEVLENGSLVLPVNGGQVIIEGFAAAATFDPPVELTNNDGTVIELGDFLVAIDVPLDVLVEAAAGGGEPGGPLPETVAPNEGAGFSPGPGPVILGVLDPEGPVDPTALQYRVPEREPFIIDIEDEDDGGPDAIDDTPDGADGIPGTEDDVGCVVEGCEGYGYDFEEAQLAIIGGEGEACFFIPSSVSGNVLTNDIEGPDGPVTITGIVYVGCDSATPLTVTDDGGSPIITFTANDGSNDVWALEFNLDTGDYTFTLLAAYDHSDVPEDALENFQYTIQDVSGDTDSALLTVCIDDDVPEILFFGAEGGVTLDETVNGGDDDGDGNPLATKTFSVFAFLNVDYGADHQGAAPELALNLSAPNANSGLTDTLSNQAVILVQLDANTIVGRTAVSGLEVFRITFNPGTEEITVTQLRAVVHGDSNDPDDVTSIAGGLVRLEVTVTDGDGDTDSEIAELGSFIDFRDDGPTAVNDTTASVDENAAEIGGNVLTNDAAGSDGGAKVVSFTYDGGVNSANVPDGGSVTVVTALGGTLTVHSNGAWTYDPPANVAADTHDDFVYTMEDGDHDTSPATQPIIVVNVPPQIEPPTAALTVNNGGIFKEDVPNSVHISAAVTDASDHLTTVEIQGLTWDIAPADLTALQGNPSVASATFVAGTLTITFAPGIDSFDYDLPLTPPEDTDVDLAGVTISATAADDTDPSATAGFTAAPVTLVVDAILDDFADGSQTAVPSVVESVDPQTVDLNLSLTLTGAGFPNSGAGGADTDTSEVVTSVTVTLSGGTLVLDPGYAGTAVVTDNGGGSFTLSGWTDFADLQNAVNALSASLPAGFDNGTITGQLSVTTQEANTPAGTVAGSGAEPDVADNTRTDTTDFTVNVTDDGPDPTDDAATVGDAGNTVTNLVIVFDRSGSMDEDPGVDGFATRMDLARAAVAALMNSYNTFGPVNIMIVDFAGQPTAFGTANNSGWLTGADAVQEAIDYLAGLQPDGNTNYQAAVQEVQDAYAGAPATADQQFVYFISDGNPTVGGDATTHELTAAQITAWENFLTTNDFDTAFAVGVGAGVTNIDALEDVAWPNSATDPVDPLADGNPIIVADEADLLDSLIGTVSGGEVTDDVLANDTFGVDGPDGGVPYVKSIVIDGFTYEYDPLTGNVTKDGAPFGNTTITDIATDFGKLTFNFATGAFTYKANDVTNDQNETFTYSVVDDDGTEATADLIVTINDVDTSVIARDDRIITNIANGQSILIPAAALLFNDFHFDGGTLSISAVENALGGSVGLVGDDVQFDKTANDAEFDYTATDGGAGSDDAHVDISTDTTGALDGTNDREILIADNSGATINALAGSDFVIGGSGGDTVQGGDGADVIFGGAGADTLFGDNTASENDTFFGGGDFLDGGNDIDVDTLIGGDGDDTIIVRVNDIADGNDDSDILILKDNLNFGSVDGGRAADVQNDNASQPNGGMTNHRGDILVFDGDLNFNGPNAAEVLTGRQVSGIETISMREAEGSTGDTTDILTLQAADVIAMGTGTYDPDGDEAGGVNTGFGEDDALRVDGDAGDVLNLTDLGWSQITPADAPAGYNVGVHDGSAAGGIQEDAYVLVQAVITVNAS